MVYLTLSGLRDALEYVHNHPRDIKFHTTGDRNGLMVNPEGFTDEQAYHLRIIQVLTPKLVTRLAEDYTALTLDGQELLDVLYDEPYLQAVVEKIKSLGFTSISDRQVFRFLKDEMAGMTTYRGVQLPQMFDNFFDAALKARDSRQTTDTPAFTPVPEQEEPAAIGHTDGEYMAPVTAGDIIEEVKGKSRKKA